MSFLFCHAEMDAKSAAVDLELWVLRARVNYSLSRMQR